MSACIDDVNVIMSAEHVREKLAQYGMMCKNPEHLKGGARVPGVEVCGERKTAADARKRDPKCP